MSTITQYLNKLFSGASPNKPLMTGDVMKGSDYARDFWWLWDRVGKLLADLSGASTALLSGGLVTQGADVNHVNITAAVGYAPFTVNVGTDGLSPPTIGTEDVTMVRIPAAAQTALALTGVSTTNVVTNATLDGSTPNYVKIKYLEVNGLSRTRLKATGTWNFTVTPSYLLTIDSVAPTAYEVLLATLVGNGSSTLTITQYYPANGYYAWSLSGNAAYTILNDGLSDLRITTSTYTATVTLPAVASSVGRRIYIKKSDSGTGKITVQPATGEILAGVTNGTWDITVQGGYLYLLSDGTRWEVVGAAGSIYQSLTSSGSQATATSGTWYNIGGSVTVPAGTYRVGWNSVLQVSISGPPNGIRATLSTANNSESDAYMTAMFEDNTPTIIVDEGSRTKVLTVASATTFYLNAMNHVTSGTTITLVNATILVERIG